MPEPRIRFADAKPEDVPAIAALQNAAAGALTAQYGEGPWSTLHSERSVEQQMLHARIRVGRVERRVITSLRLATRKPWAIDTAYFTSARQPLYLTDMVVAVAHQREGRGRQALEDAVSIAGSWPADAIRLDAYDADAGAGGFYASCGFSERGRVVYRDTPHIYYELMLEKLPEPDRRRRRDG